jgi:hypothetical protein
MYVDGVLPTLHGWTAPERGATSTRGGGRNDDDREQVQGSILWFLVGWLSEQLRQPIGPETTLQSLRLEPKTLRGIAQSLADRFGLDLSSQAVFLRSGTLRQVSERLANEIERP